MRRMMLLAATLVFALVALAPAFAAEGGDWRAEFEAVCSQTDVSMNLADDELAALIARCDRLSERIAGEAEVVRKVFLRRLQSCRELFAYVLESRKARAGAPPAGPAEAVAPGAPAASDPTPPPPAENPGQPAPPEGSPAGPRAGAPAP